MVFRKLSIIIPVYNCESFLETCLNSIVSEMNELIELILINDGSIDGSGEICEKYSNQYENIIYLLKNNTGVSDTRNVGINSAQGEYIIFVDSDDFLAKGWSKVVFSLFEKDADFTIIESGLSKELYTKKEVFDCLFHLNHNIKWCSTPWSKIYKRSLLLEKKILFETNVFHGEDLLFNAEVISNSTNILFSNKNIYYYRQNNLSITKSFNKNIFESDKKFLSIVKQKYDIKYYYFCLENAIMMFLNKISQVNYMEGFKFYRIFREEPYSSYIRNNSDYFNKSRNILFNFIKYDLIFILIIAFKAKNIIARNKIDSLIKI
ncbi:glycosyltransferase [Streptococcus parasuis]|uniref:glycosyltransferase n=1 Tax=Streptococcus parasuis TaxID=1501662 RepID=UPI0028B1A2D5|nr:glycosyltransferase [Streptococcus parasuis]